MRRRRRPFFGMTKKTVLMIDPPQGWHHGFPKPCPDNWAQMEWEEKRQWYIDNNYPAEKIDSYGDKFYCSIFRQEVEEEEHTNFLEGKANLL